MAVDGDPVPGAAAEQLVDRQSGELALDVPQGGVDRGDRAHRHRPAPPVGAPVEVLPGVLDPGRVAAQQHRDDVVGQVGGDGQLPAVEGGVADPGDPLVRHDLEGDEVAPGAGDDHFRVRDLHGAALRGLIPVPP
jgi:hypothetical protein